MFNEKEFLELPQKREGSLFLILLVIVVVVVVVVLFLARSLF